MNSYKCRISSAITTNCLRIKEGDYGWEENNRNGNKQR